MTTRSIDPAVELEARWGEEQFLAETLLSRSRTAEAAFKRANKEVTAAMCRAEKAHERYCSAVAAYREAAGRASRAYDAWRDALVEEETSAKDGAA